MFEKLTPNQISSQVQSGTRVCALCVFGQACWSFLRSVIFHREDSRIRPPQQVYIRHPEMLMLLEFSPQGCPSASSMTFCLFIPSFLIAQLIYPNHNTKSPLSKHEKVSSEDEMICFL